MELIAGEGLFAERESFGEHFGTSCYLVGPEHGSGALVVDPGQGALDWVAERLAATGRTLAGVLVTHGHMDHTWDVWPVAERWSVPVYLAEDDHVYLVRPESALAAHFPARLLAEHPRRLPADLRGLPPEPFVLGGVRVRALRTPGHTPGSACFVLSGGEDAPAAFLATGDTVLSTGRGPVFPPIGDAAAHTRSWASLQVELERVGRVLPGHGASLSRPFTWVSR